MKLIYLKNKNILVTGGAGFLGSYVVERLKKEDINDIFVPRSKDYDLVDKDNIVRLFNDFKPNVVLHLAALAGGIGINRKKPGEFFYKNLMMGIQLIEEARLKKVEKFVALGTICSYPKFTPVPFKEEDIWNGYPDETNAPYGLAKKIMLVQAQAYRQQYNFNVIHPVPVNLYGPRDNFNPKSSHVIPALIKKMYDAIKNNHNEIVVWGDGTASREFLYVEDAAEGIILATEHYNKSEPINLGSGKEITIKELTYKIKDIIGFKGKIKWDTTKPNGQPRRYLDTTKAKQEFSFEAKTELDKGLAKTIKWYKENPQ